MVKDQSVGNPSLDSEGELRSLRSLIDSKPGREASVNTESLKVEKPQGYNQDTPSPSAGGPKTGHCWHTHLMWSLGGHWAGAPMVCRVPSIPRPSAGAVPLPKTCSAWAFLADRPSAGPVPSANLSKQRACLAESEEEMARREEKRGRSRRARGSPGAAYVVRRFSESAARQAAPRPIKLETSFSNLLCPRPLADGLVPVDTRGLGRPPDRELKGTNLSATCGHPGFGRPHGRLGTPVDQCVGHPRLDSGGKLQSLNFETSS